MTLRMYSASRSPRLSSTCWRMASSSRPRFSMSPALRWAIGFFSWRCRVVIEVPLQVDVAGARCRGYARLDLDAVTGCGGGDVAVAKVAYGSLAQRCHAAEADAHPASRRHQHSGSLARVQQRSVAWGFDGCRGLAEGDSPALTGGDHGGPEPFCVEALGHTVVVPVLLEGVEHACRSARPRLALGEVTDQIGEFGGAEHAVGVSVLLDQADSALAGHHAEFAREDHIVGRGS